MSAGLEGNGRGQERMERGRGEAKAESLPGHPVPRPDELQASSGAALGDICPELYPEWESKTHALLRPPLQLSAQSRRGKDAGPSHGRMCEGRPVALR